ncbi:MAG: chromosome segregation protein SMC [Polaromonas sp.]|nr:chromosome segregation protein SMC [Polaromonas sp.]
MRLNSIKLAGFKSFADPTHFQLPGQLVGVVGPNGCGKSNIMDAVRWVLGESKASELRGESMQDVIFSGTTRRKAASRASVELVFDNADHRAGGQWGQYLEIAVKRVLSRDGNSNYYLNNQPVRRRDVQDVFLGTGLGPRAYAIIGQGTISRIIESKPEELRLFLEEAAGVSKYKERRRETASRLADTRDNLTRVEDIRRELAANLERLESQAEVALRYRALHTAGLLKQHQLWFFKRADGESEQARAQLEATKSLNELESRLADLRHAEAALESLRQAHFGAGEQVSQAQGKLYEASAEVGRLEAEIRFVAEGRLRVEQRLVQLQAQADQWAGQRVAAALEGASLAAKALEAQEHAELLAAQLYEQHDQLAGLEEALRQAQARANAQQAEVTLRQQQLQVLAAEQRHVQEQLRLAGARHERLSVDRKALHAPDLARLDRLNLELAQARQSHALAQALVQELTGTVPRLDAARRLEQQTANTESARRADLSARLQALRALQEKVRTDGKLLPWLARHGLDGLPALWSCLQVEPGWENALEAALRERLGAIEISRLDMVRGFVAGSEGGSQAAGPPAKLSFYIRPRTGAPGPSRAVLLQLKPLADLLVPGDAGLSALLGDWLHGCFTAGTLDEALAERERLLPGESIYLMSGHAVTGHSVSFYAPDSEQTGLLARARDIENLEKWLGAQQLTSDQAAAALARAEAQCQEASQRLASAQGQAAQGQSQCHALQVEVLRLAQLAEQARARAERIDADMAEVNAQLTELQERKAAAQNRFEELGTQQADSLERQAQLNGQASHAEQHRTGAREQQRTLERQLQEAQFVLRTLAARADELSRAIAVASQQGASVAADQGHAQDELQRLSNAAAQSGLQAALAHQLAHEAELVARRNQHDGLAQQMRAGDERRLKLELELGPLRQRITEAQLREQAARLGFEQYAQLLADAQADVPAVGESIRAGNVRLAGLQAEIDRIQQGLQALGAVNLAALDELAAARERQQFLGAQSADLNEAMATLENAIRKIDMETRDLLRATFEAVNSHFGRMFPELFGGGNARLVMTGEEILDAGVQVMAQPPGKKNQTIHLLSGGEKALTAIALVFAIFQLNPAPFCLLDEVDAPLDDANTERYAKLVSSMSQQTQFLFISHNKIAMAMAEQLIGVTMQEQGVSRIVAVDMLAALSFAQAA